MPNSLYYSTLVPSVILSAAKDLKKVEREAVELEGHWY
jgi:hypothetical protein